MFDGSYDSYVFVFLNPLRIKLYCFSIWFVLQGSGIIRWACQAVMDGTAEVHGYCSPGPNHVGVCGSDHWAGGEDR